MKDRPYSSFVRYAVVISHCILLASCGPKQSQYTVEYYTQHPDERKAKLAECANDPGALRDDALCINAAKAGAKAGLGSWRDLKPMGLLKEQEERERKEMERAAKEAAAK